MKTIQLGKGKIALIDDEDYALVGNIRWFCNTFGYAVGHVGKKRRAFMHRLILGIIDDPSKHTDHINRNRLDNRRCNLRICTYSQNNANTSPSGKSKYLGVVLDTQYRKYTYAETGITKIFSYNYIYARIKRKGRSIHLGSFKTEEAAARAYDKAAKKYHGEFANLNFKD